MVDFNTKVKYWEQLKLEESQLLEQFQKIRQMLFKSSLDAEYKKHIDNELDPIIDLVAINFNSSRNKLDVKDSNIGNIIEK